MPGHFKNPDTGGVGIKPGAEIEKWTTVGILKTLFEKAELRDDCEINANTVGNINVYEAGERGAWIGYLDMMSDTFYYTDGTEREIVVAD